MPQSPQPWTFARVFELMSKKQKTGVLEVLSPDGETRIHLQEGKVTHLESWEGEQWKLGDFLIESETLTRAELARVTRKATKYERSIEEELVSSNYVSTDIIKRFVELDIRESIFPLFSKSGITCKLREEEPQSNSWGTQIPVAYFLRNAARRSERWPSLRKRIPHDDQVFDKLDAWIPTILGQVEGIVMSEDAKVRVDASQEHITGNERIVYYYVNGKKTVRQLAYASCLGEFDTYEALVKLFDRGFIELHSAHGRGEKQKKKRVLLPALARVIGYGIPALVIAWLALARPGALQSPASLFALAPPELEALLAHHGQARVERAVEASFLETGTYPEEPKELLDKGWLTEEAFEYVDLSRYRHLRGPPERYRWVD